MRNPFTKWMRKKDASVRHEIAPDEIFLDASNLPNFDVQQFEGRLERPISRKVVFFASLAFLGICFLLLGKAWVLQIRQGEAYSILSERNSLKKTVIFEPRGIIYDRNGVQLVANTTRESHPEYPSREYMAGGGASPLLGYLEY